MLWKMLSCESSSAWRLRRQAARAAPGPLWGAIAVVGSIPPIVPRFHWPGVALSSVPELLSIAFALTIVALGQSISIAKAVAARSGQAIDANREFRGQGLSNIVGGFFSSYVSCGSLNRSVPNLQAGARTPLAAVLSALFMLVLVGAVSGWLAQIPMAAIAALLLLVAWNLFDVRRWRELWRVSRRDFWIAGATLVATVTLRLEMAIVLGTLLSLTVFLHRTSRPAMRTMGFVSPPEQGLANRPFVVLDGSPGALPECPQLKLLRMEGEVYFGALQHVADTLHAQREAPDAQRHLLVMAKSMNFIDPAGAETTGYDKSSESPNIFCLAVKSKMGLSIEVVLAPFFCTSGLKPANILRTSERFISFSR